MSDLIVKMNGSPNLIFEDTESSCGGKQGIPVSYEGEACGILPYEEIPKLIRWLSHRSEAPKR